MITSRRVGRHEDDASDWYPGNGRCGGATLCWPVDEIAPAHDTIGVRQ